MDGMNVVLKEHEVREALAEFIAKQTKLDGVTVGLVKLEDTGESVIGSFRVFFDFGGGLGG